MTLPEPRLLGTNHTSFTVSSLDRAIAFWRDGLGFSLRDRGPRDPRIISAITAVPGADAEIAYLDGAGHTIELIEYRGPADRGRVDARPCDAGFAHVAFDVDGIDALVSRAIAHGAGPLAPVVTNGHGPNSGARVVYLRDPDGCTIELIDRSGRAT